MRAYEFILLEEKVRKVNGNSATGLIKLEYEYDAVTNIYSGKFSIAYVNLTISKFYSLKTGRIIGIDNINDLGKVEVHCHVLNKYLSVPSLNNYTYPQLIGVFF